MKKVSENKKLKKGFTLIEMLVVVLIIGILAAIALPQYRKAVERANAAEALPLLKAFCLSQQEYYVLHNTYARKFSDLDVSIPWSGNTKWRNSSVMRDTISNDKWSLQIYSENGFVDALYLGRISGKYKGSGFVTLLYNCIIECAERIDNGIVLKGNEGDYCEKVFNATKYQEDWNIRVYKMPKF